MGSVMSTGWEMVEDAAKVKWVKPTLQKFKVWWSAQANGPILTFASRLGTLSCEC
jgi:hypothetical protein